MEENDRAVRTRRKRHSAAFKAEAVKACLQPGVSVAAVALHYRLNANMLRTWVTAHERALAEQHRAANAAPAAEFVALPMAVPHETSALPSTSLHIRINLATVSRFKLATPTRQKVATHSHFKIATLRRAGVRDEPVIDKARNSNAASRQHPQTSRRLRAVDRNKDFTFDWRLSQAPKDASR